MECFGTGPWEHFDLIRAAPAPCARSPASCACSRRSRWVAPIARNRSPSTCASWAAIGRCSRAASRTSALHRPTSSVSSPTCLGLGSGDDFSIGRQGRARRRRDARRRARDRRRARRRRRDRLLHRPHDRAQRSEMDRPETIEETAELVDAAGGHGIAVPVDHLDPEQVRALVDAHRARAGRAARPRERHLGRDHDGVGQDGVGVRPRRRPAHAAARRRHARDHEPLRAAAADRARPAGSSSR